MDMDALKPHFRFLLYTLILFSIPGCFTLIAISRSESFNFAYVGKYFVWHRSPYCIPDDFWNTVPAKDWRESR